MRRVVLLLSLLILGAMNISAQDTLLAFLKKELIRIDSIAKSVDNNKQLKVSPVTGASAVRKQYNAMAYQQPRSLELQKLSIVPVSSGEQQTVYVIGKKILKVVLESGEYYAINNSYYDNSLARVVSPPLLENFSDCQDILKIVTSILTPVKK